MKTKNRMRKAGFTLVELIVVIAVLGILGAGAAVGYSGYVKKAAKAADEQLVSQIKYALEVAYVADPSYSGAAAVVLSKDADANVTGEADSAAVKWVQTALTNAFGANWKNELKLEYDGWNQQIGNSLAVFSGWGDGDDTERTAALEALVAAGDEKAVPSFANKVDELFDLIETTSMDVGDKLGKSGVRLLQDAAKVTTDPDSDLCTAEEFALAWAAYEWESDALMDDKGEYDGTTVESNRSNKDFMSKAVANAGIIKARNVSVATYLQNEKKVDASVCDFIANYTYGYGSTNATDYMKKVPQDIMKSNSFADDLKKVLLSSGTIVNANDANAWVKKNIWPYLGLQDVPGSPPTQVNVNLEETQAYKDGLAYYAMMDTINKTSGTAGSTDDTYWNDMRSAVSVYGQIASGKLTLESLRKLMSGNDGAMIIVTPDNGKLKLISTIEAE